MADNSILPKAQSQLVDQAGRPTRAFYNFFNALVSQFQSQINTLRDVVTKLAAVIAALGGDAGDLPDIPAMIAGKADKTETLQGTQSIRGGGDLSSPRLFALDGDMDAPPALSFYGVLTDDLGRGWQLVSGNFAALDNGDGTYALDLADLADSGTGAALVKITRDAKGRLSGTSAATTTDLTEGSNLYFTTARAAAAAPVQSVAGKTGAVTLAKGDVGLGNADNTSDANKPVSTAQQTALDLKSDNSVFADYIAGLKMVWVSGTALAVTTGAAYIPGISKVLRVSSDIAKTGLSLTASTWYHVYLYNNAGTPDVEIVTTAPAAAYSGTARTKTGGASRRYLISVLTDSSSNLWAFKHYANRVVWQLNIASGTNITRILANGQATTATTVSGAGCMPVTAVSALLRLGNTDASILALVSSGDYPLTTADALFSAKAGVPIFSEVQCDSSQAFKYIFQSTPSGGLYLDVNGYVFER